MSLLKTMNQENYRTYSLAIAKQVGVNGAILFNWFIYLVDTHNSWEVFSSYPNISKVTCLTENEIKTAIKKLKEANFIKVEKKGVPAKNYYYLLESNILSYLENHSPVSEKITHQSVKKSLTSELENNSLLENRNNNNKTISKKKSEDVKQNYLDVDFLISLFTDEEIEYYSKDLLIDWFEYNIIDHKKKERALKMQINKLKSDFNQYDKEEIRNKIRYSITSNHKDYYTDKLKNIAKERLELEEYKRKHREEAFADVKDNRPPEVVEAWEKQKKRWEAHLKAKGIYDDE